VTPVVPIPPTVECTAETNQPRRIVHVADLEAPLARLCWQASPAPAILRCDRAAAHGGLHSWEYPNVPHLRRV